MAAAAMLVKFFFSFQILIRCFSANTGSFEGNLVCHCFTDVTWRDLFVFSLACRLFLAFKNRRAVTPLAHNLRRLLSAAGLMKDMTQACLYIAPPAPADYWLLIRWSQPWISSCLGYHQRSLTQQGLIHHHRRHQSCSSDTHITLCRIQMELSRNSNVFTSRCQLWAAFSGTRRMQQWVTARPRTVFDFCSRFSCQKVKNIGVTKVEFIVEGHLQQMGLVVKL